MNPIPADVLVSFDPVYFYQQKMLLIEIQAALYQKYRSEPLQEMLESVIELYDSIGDAAEANGDFEYPQYNESKNGFADDSYNHVFKQLTGEDLSLPPYRADTHHLAMSIVDIFDDFLCDKNISVPCSDSNEESAHHADGNAAAIYGPEYYDLADAVEAVLSESIVKGSNS